MVEENENQKSAATVSLAGVIKENNILYLRLVKKGDDYTAYYSVDGKKFVKAASAKAALKDINVGVVSFAGSANAAMARMPQGAPAAPATASAPFKASFDYFKISNTSAK